MFEFRKAAQRGGGQQGWLETFHTFSFAHYYDPKWMGFSDLRVINDDRIAPKSGFGTHSHQNMEIVTYMISGELTHRDSLGNESTLTSGELQRMSAGTGISHSEMNHTDNPVHMLQIWIETEKKGINPDYEQKQMKDLTPGHLHLVIAPKNEDAPMSINQKASILLGKFDQEGGIHYVPKNGKNCWIHVIKGELTIGGETLYAHDSVGISGEHVLDLTHSEQSEFLLFDLR